MNIITSDARNYSPFPDGIVISMDAKTCLVTSDNISAYSGEILDAASIIFLSKV